MAKKNKFSGSSDSEPEWLCSKNIKTNRKRGRLITGDFSKGNG